MEKIRDFIKVLPLDVGVDFNDPPVEDEEFFRDRCLQGFDRLLSFKDKHKDKPALVMGHGPSLLEVEKEKHHSSIKITCNDFHKIPDFFDDDFKPDFWCSANSLAALRTPFLKCLEEKITCLITVPKKREFEELFKLYDKENDLVIPWIWEFRLFQAMLAKKYGLSTTYSRCNTITNHMIALALWLGCNPISVTGFDLSYKKSWLRTGQTHAGYTEDLAENITVMGLCAFDNPREKKQIIGDLKYLCKIAYNDNIKIHNLSFKQNKLPYNLSYREK